MCYFPIAALININSPDFTPILYGLDTKGLAYICAQLYTNCWPFPIINIAMQSHEARQA
jgi:hypothetical protein